jgi:hypothetical protein
MCLQHRWLATSAKRATENAALLLWCAFASSELCLPSRCIEINYSGFQSSRHIICSFMCNSSICARTIYTRFLQSLLGRAASVLKCSSCNNGYLDTWTAVHLLDRHQVPASFISYAGLLLVRYPEHYHFRDFVWLLLVSCTISLCNHKYTTHGNTYHTRGPVWI